MSNAHHGASAAASGGPAPAPATTRAEETTPAASAEAEAVEVTCPHDPPCPMPVQRLAKAIGEERRAAADRWAAEQTANGQRRDRELAEQLYREAAQYEPGRFWRVVTTEPGGRVNKVEYVDRDEVVEHLAAASFEMEQRPGWTVRAESVT